MTRDRVSIEVLNSLIARKCYAISDAEQIAVMKAVTSLYGPVPDPETGLVPCGCGGKLVLCTMEQPEFSVFVSPVYGVRCNNCLLFLGYYDTKEEAIKAANAAMGWRG